MSDRALTINVQLGDLAIEDSAVFFGVLVDGVRRSGGSFIPYSGISSQLVGAGEERVEIAIALYSADWLEIARSEPILVSPMTEATAK
jgi:hypothetical protein